VAQFASVQDVELTRVELEMRATYPADGVAHITGSAMQQLTYTVDVDSPASAERIRALLEVAERECHATNTLRVPVPVIPRIRLNGQDLDFTLPPPAPAVNLLEEPADQSRA
jgi:hypothetical protein